MGIHTIYFILFSLSLMVLSLQIVLAFFLKFIVLSPFFAISYAFLGLSTSGVFFYLRYFNRNKLNPRFHISFFANISGLLLLLYLCLIKYLSILKSNSVEKLAEKIVEQKLPFHIFWSKQLIRSFVDSFFVGLSYAILFFCLGLIFAFIYRYYSNKATRLYLADLSGASCGCVIVVALLHFLQLSSIMIVFSFCAFLIAFLVSRGKGDMRRVKYKTLFYLIFSILLFIFNLGTDFFEITVNPHYLALELPIEKECEEVWHRSNAYSSAYLVKRRHPNWKRHQYVFSVDMAEGLAPVESFNPRNPYRYKLFTIRQDPVNLSFLIDKPKDILILFAGAGRDMIRAFSYSGGTSNITGVEINPLIVNKAKALRIANLKTFFSKDNVNMVIGEARNYLETTDKKFDSIILTWAGVGSAQYLGVNVSKNEYLYTMEAFKSYLTHLKPNGTLVVWSGNKIKVVAALKEAFRKLGIHDVRNKIAVLEFRTESNPSDIIGSFWATNPVIVKKANFTQQEIKKIEKVISKMGMGFIYSPTFTHRDFLFFRDLVERGNTHATLRKLEEKHRVNLTLPTDDRPFAENMFLLKNIFTKHFWSLIRHGEPGVHPRLPRQGLYHFFLILFILFLIVIGLVLIILPLIKRRDISRNSLKVLFYFSTLGMGFIFVEIAVMQIFTLFLGNPIYSYSVVLASLLLSTGCGSFLSHYFFKMGYLTIKKIALISFLILILYFSFLPQINKYLLHLGLALKLLITLMSIFPIGICLGMFFPQGLEKLYKRKKNLIPWAWGINGYMSIIGSALSIYLTINIGFSRLILISAILYFTIIFFDIK